MNDDQTNHEPVDVTELSPTRAERIARVRSRGRQIRARRRLAITGLTALVVLAIAAPAIAIGTRSTSHGVTPVTAGPARPELQVAPVRAVQQPPCPAAAVVSPDLGNRCLSLGAPVADEHDVLSASVVNEGEQGWTVRVRLDARTAPGLLRLKPGSRVVIIVGEKVLDAPSIEPGATSETVVVVEPRLTRAQAIALATRITGRPPHIDATPSALATSIELPGGTFVAGLTVHGTLVIDNTTGHAVTLEAQGACQAKWAVSLTNASVPLSVNFRADCGAQHTDLVPGSNSFPITVATTYTMCTGAGGVGIAGEVHCLPDGSIPPLPPGEYQVVLTTDPRGILPPPAPLSIQVVAALPATPRLGALSLQTGDRSIKLLVPAGWKFAGQDAGGSGSSSTWTNPVDAYEEIYGATGVELGGWWETDGVNGSINPQGFVPKAAHVQRVNYTTFLYQVGAGAGDVTDGVWIANVTAQGPDSYVMAHVTLPSALHATATTILNRFISDRNAVFPPLSGPPPPFVRP